MLLVACGSAPERPTRTPQRSKPAAAAVKPKKRARARAPKQPWMTRKCTRKRASCLPPKNWVNRLCNDVYPDVALHMFGPKTPWRRLYMLADADAFNASGGASLIGDKMRRGEEVIALRRRKTKEGVTVSDSSGYDVLRWNGACATIHDGDFATEPPSELGHARVEWRELGLPLRQKLEAQPAIQEIYEARRKACRGRTIGVVSAECEQNDQRLVDEVVRYVRSGGKLPAPTKAP